MLWFVNYCEIVLIGNINKEKEHKNITYLGNIVNTEELADLYSLADVFVNPSIQETFGKTTAEAISCGTPVVAFNSSATPEIIGEDGNCGILISINDVSFYADGIMQVIKKGKDFYIQQCRKRAKQLFNKEVNMTKYIDIFNQLSE